MYYIELSCVFFSFSMAIKGYKMPLEAKDLWSLNQRDSSKVMVPNLLKEWEKEQIKAKRFALKTSGRIAWMGHVSLIYVISSRTVAI